MATEMASLEFSPVQIVAVNTNLEFANILTKTLINHFLHRNFLVQIKSQKTLRGLMKDGQIIRIHMIVEEVVF